MDHLVNATSHDTLVSSEEVKATSQERSVPVEAQEVVVVVLDHHEIVTAHAVHPR